MAEKTSGSASGSSKRKKKRAKKKGSQDLGGSAVSVASPDNAVFSGNSRSETDGGTREEKGNERTGGSEVCEESSVTQKPCRGCSDTTVEGDPVQTQSDIKVHTITALRDEDATHSLQEQKARPLPRVKQSSTKEPIPAHSEAVARGSTFEEELEWCVGQLELGLTRTDASNSQKQENKRHIKTLRSSKTSMPRKRQIMRSLFGDYRSKLRTQPLPKSALPPKEPRITAVGKAALETTGKFYKQSAFASTATHAEPRSDKKFIADAGALSGVQSTEFRFDFDVDAAN